MYFGSESGVKSRVNLAVSYTISEAIRVVAGLPELIYNKVLITRGELTSFQNAVLTTQPGGVLHLEWEDNSTQGNAAPADQVSIFSGKLGLQGEVYDWNRQFSEVMPGTAGSALYGKLGFEVSYQKFSLGSELMLPAYNRLAGGDIEARSRFSLFLNFGL